MKRQNNTGFFAGELSRLSGLSGAGVTSSNS